MEFRLGFVQHGAVMGIRTRPSARHVSGQILEFLDAIALRCPLTLGHLKSVPLAVYLTFFSFFSFFSWVLAWSS